jgi:hypothetical protein
MPIGLDRTPSPELLQMARWLAGDFSNQEQAWENPPFFAQIRVAYRPLPAHVWAGSAFMWSKPTVAIWKIPIGRRWWN